MQATLAHAKYLCHFMVISFDVGAPHPPGRRDQRRGGLYSQILNKFNI